MVAGCRDNIESLGNDCLLMAASHLHKNVPPFSILGGTPAVSPKRISWKEKAPKRALREINKLKDLWLTIIKTCILQRIPC